MNDGLDFGELRSAHRAIDEFEELRRLQDRNLERIAEIRRVARERYEHDPVFHHKVELAARVARSQYYGNLHHHCVVEAAAVALVLAGLTPEQITAFSVTGRLPEGTGL